MAETIDQLKSELQASGWRFARDSDYSRTNDCDWYARMPKRPQEWPDCECNDKPPAVGLHPFVFTVDGRTHDSCEFKLTGQMHGRWYTLTMYSVGIDEAMQAAPKAIATLGAAWKAIAALEE